MFGVDEFLLKMKQFVEQNPHLASRAYAKASLTLRREALRSDNKAIAYKLQQFANRLETLAAQAELPTIEPNYGEQVAEWADDSRNPTEIDSVVADLAASRIGPDGEQNDEIHAALQFENMQAARRAEVSPPVQITPASARPGITLFGQNALVQFGGNPTTGSPGQFGGQVSAQQEAQVIRWDGQEQETLAVTIALAIALRGAGATYPTGSSGATEIVYRPYARIQWGGSRGQPNEAIVDVGTGCQLTLACNYLYVNVGMDAPASSGLIEGSMLCSGTFGFFSASRVSPVTRTAFVDSLGSGQTLNVVRPLFATQLLSVERSDPTLQVTLNFKNAFGTTIYSRVIAANTYLSSPIPLSTDVYSIDVVNGSGTTNGRLIFGIAL